MSVTPSTSPAPEAVIVGAGPVGLWLAHELALTGVQVLVLERDEVRSPHSKALGIMPRTVEVLALRDRHRDLLTAGRRSPGWHFGMLESRVDFSALPTPFPFMVIHPQRATEELLEQYAREAGVVVRRGSAVTSLTQDDSSVTLRVSGPEGEYEVSAPYVVGADGARSTVRREAGIAFPGTESSAYGFIGEVVLDDPPSSPGFAARSADGMFLVVPLGDGRFRLAGYDAVHQRREPLTMEELRDASLRIAGTDFGMHSPSWLTRFGNATKVAAAYRAGRVLLAGDAAHIHWPAGGVGLNVGLQDAMNLGWKLAAVIQGRAGTELLDTYHAERHPVGLELAGHTLAQGALITRSTPETAALRGLLNEAITTGPAFSGMLARKLSGLDVVYRSDDPAAHPLTGARVHDPAGDGVFPLLHDGRAVLLVTGEEPLDTEVTDRAAEAGIAVRAGGIAGPGGPGWSGATAVLVRPDGRVWWATGTPPGQQLTAEIAKALTEVPAVF
nr:monooxygenase [Streptomyces sp. Xyl84]